MNRADIIISHIENCTDYNDAIDAILNSVSRLGIKLTSNETTFGIEIANLFFKGFGSMEG